MRSQSFMQAVNPIDSLSRRTVFALITLYQKKLSPHKGFSCAHRVLRGGESCSQYTKRLILEQGLGDALPLVRQRFQSCKVANQILKQRKAQIWAIESGDSQEESESVEPEEPATTDPAQTQKRTGGGSFKKQPASAANTSSEQNVGLGNTCDTLSCADLSCDGLEFAAIDCGSSSEACSGLDCDFCSCGS